MPVTKKNSVALKKMNILEATAAITFLSDSSPFQVFVV